MTKIDKLYLMPSWNNDNNKYTSGKQMSLTQFWVKSSFRHKIGSKEEILTPIVNCNLYWTCQIKRRKKVLHVI
jgi:hypothetical protein